MKASWQSRILREFVAGASPITLVADPDGLLQDEGVLAGLRERGFVLLRFEDPIAFRYAYESQIRCGRREGDDASVVVLVAAGAGELGSLLPHDILANAHRVAFGLADLFPNLDLAVVALLEAAHLDALYNAQAQGLGPATPLGENASKDFVLKHVFGIVPELVRTPVDLLVVLLRRHYAGVRLPPALDARLVEAVEKRFTKWPLRSVVPDREAFFGFLQAGWRAFLDRQAEGGAAVRDVDTVLLPFDHDDVRVYVDNLFAEGLLQPVDHWQAATFAKTWLGAGVRWDERLAAAARMDRLLAIASEALPSQDAGHEDWFRFAILWAKVGALAHHPKNGLEEMQHRALEALRTRMDDAFAGWVEVRYASLASLPPKPPAMLHHIPRALAQEIGGSAMAKAALVVVDGLALEQWVVIQGELVRQRPGCRFREGAAFAWAPTVTSVSRQAIFAAEPPFYFPDSIRNTNKEAALWRRFWQSHGVAEAIYAKSLRDGPFEEVARLLEQPKVRVAGLVVDKVDSIMHGMTLGAAGMHSQVRLWASQGHFAALVSLLFGHGFRVYVTSDHGNVEAVGGGRPDEGALADVRGERVRVYSDAGLRDTVAKRFPEAQSWPGEGLPEGYLPLLAPGRKAFVREGERTVAHGGVCLEELVVPFVEVLPR